MSTVQRYKGSPGRKCRMSVRSGRRCGHIKNRIQRLKDTLGHIGTRSIAVALAVLLLTTWIAALVGNSFYATEKEVLQYRGALNAKEAAMEYDSCLLTRVNIVTVVCYAADQMLQSGAENSEIEEYLTKETDYIYATLDPSTTGLYGWVNREYLDGAGWVPDEDYVPTERPWYIETINSDEKITFVEPYLDMQTHTVMMTVSGLLNDGESVIAMDVSLDPIQQIVEQVSSATEGSQALVLDRSGIVVAHSDKDQLGRNYLEETDTLGRAVADRILRDGETQFDLQTTEGNYSVYVNELRGGWYSVSLINSELWYRPLRNIMIAFYAILILVVAFLVLVFLRLTAKNMALEQLHTRITQEKKRGETLQMLSETDRMTGLLDRVSGKRKVDELIGAEIGGMFLELDIDHFKAINDTYGHQAGDVVILGIADALRGTFRANDIIMRLGGDEFGVFAVGIIDREMGEAILHRLFARLENREIPELQGEKISISVGAVLCTGEKKRSFDELYAAADGAMYESKKVSGNSVTFSE